MENALEQAKQYAAAGIEKATELGQHAIDLVKEQIAEHSPAATSPGLTRKASVGPLSPSEEKKLESALAQRPTPKELQDKNILKESKVAPSLQAKQEELKQQQLRDSMDTKLAMRPSPDELTQKNILLDEPTSSKDGGIQAGIQALNLAKTETDLENKLEHRPAPEELIAEGILNKDENPKDSSTRQSGNVLSGDHAHNMEQTEQKLEAALESRPPPKELIAEGILNRDEDPTKK